LGTWVVSGSKQLPG